MKHADLLNLYCALKYKKHAKKSPYVINFTCSKKLSNLSQIFKYLSTIGGFLIEIKISKHIKYNLAFFYNIKIAKLYV